MMRISPLRFAAAAFRLGAGRAALGDLTGSLFHAIFSLFRRFKFTVPQTAVNSGCKSFERLNNSPSILNPDALKILRNLKDCRDISLFSGNFASREGTTERVPAHVPRRDRASASQMHCSHYGRSYLKLMRTRAILLSRPQLIAEGVRQPPPIGEVE
jgi:hypothetical protein